MKRQLSGKLTVLVKIIVPICLVLFWSAILLMQIIGVDERTAMPSGSFFILEIVILVILYFTAMKYMKVSVDDKYLYVSNYLKEIQIPLANIRDVTEIVWVRGHPVTIHLNAPSKFGRKIAFLPKSQGFVFLKPHPVVGELKELAKTNNAVNFACH